MATVRPILLERLLANPVLHYRAVGILAVVAIFLAGWLGSTYTTRTLLDWSVYGVMIAGFALVVGLTFVRHIAVRHLELVWVWLLAWGAMSQTIHNYQQNLSFEAALQSFIYTAAAAATLQRVSHLRIFLGLAAINVTGTVLMLPEPVVSGMFFLSQMLPFIGFLYLILASAILSRSQRLEAENRLLLSERTLQRAQRVLRVGNWEYYPGGRLQFSDSLWEILARPPLPSLLISDAIDMMAVPAEQPVLLAHLESLQSGVARDFEMQCAVLSGEGQCIDIRVIGQRGSGDVQIFGTVQDISHQAEQTRLLNEARLAAESAAAARTQFLANMSHEIRTPMNGVIGMTSLLGGTELNHQQKDYVETIRASGESLLHIINSILDFSKVDAGQIQLESHAFDLEACLADALDVVLPSAMEKDLELLFDWDLDLPEHYIGDSSRIRQVVINLLGNAVKFTDRGEVCLAVREQDSKPRAAPAEEGREICLLEIAVIDSGLGIPKEQIDRVFDAFTQADASTTRRFGGTGLGLSITRELVHLMGGEIEVSSEYGRGSTFRCLLPMQVTAGTRTESLETLRGCRVLAVDDNQTNRRVLESYLTRLGMNARVLEDPRGLLDAYLADTDCRMLILDMHMPGMDGVELARALRAIPDRRPLLILLSSLGDGQHGELFDYTFTKPIRPRQLTDALISLLQEKDAGGPPERLPAESSNTYRFSVLVAEDNLVNQKVAQGLLSRLGVKADVVANGREAVEMLSQRHYDVVFMDVQMPEVDGLEATRLVRENPDMSQPHIIAMTANAMQSDREECLAAGMDDFLTKPVRLQALSEVLARADVSLREPGSAIREIRP